MKYAVRSAALPLRGRLSRIATASEMAIPTGTVPNTYMTVFRTLCMKSRSLKSSM